MADTILLSIKDLHASIGDKEILKGINLEIRPGEIHAVMGPNGAGKSTLSSVLAGKPQYEVTSGSITFMGKDLLQMRFWAPWPLPLQDCLLSSASTLKGPRCRMQHFSKIFQNLLLMEYSISDQC